METALNPERREVWVGLPTVITILADKLAPGVLGQNRLQRPADR